MILAAESAGFVQSIWEFVQAYPDVVLIGIFILCGIGLPIPEEPVLLMAGAVAEVLAQGENIGMGPQLLRMTIVCTIGILLGDLLCFQMGRILGQDILKWRLVARIATRPRRVRAERFFQKYGAWSIFIARFFAGVRLVMYFSAGMSRKVGHLKFLFMDFLGCMVSVPISVYIGYIVYHELKDWTRAKEKLGPFHLVIMSAIVIGLVVWWLIHRYRKRVERERRYGSRPAA
jgi:membrane protein DedA with SNARE-associated domain